MLTTMCVALVGMCLFVGVFSHVQFLRDQQLAYDDFRGELARGSAPVGATFVEDAPVEATGGQERADAAGLDEVSTAPLLLPTGTPVALMSIPAIGVRDVVVLEGTTSGVLQSGAGHDRQTALPGQVGWSQVMGRRWAYGGPLRDLPSLVAGDDITFTTGQGVSRYEVTGFRRGGDPVPRRATGEGRLVMVTADGPAYVAQEPIYLDAQLRTPAQPSGGAAVIPTDPASKPLAGDPSAWFELLLWAQGLAAVAVGAAWARARWGVRQAWLVGVPVATAVGVGAANAVMQLLPNLL